MNAYDSTEEENDNWEKTLEYTIDPSIQEDGKLVTLDQQLRKDVPVSVALGKIDQSMDIDIFIYNVKDFIMMFFLLLSSSINFNYLYIPFIIIGLLYYCLILENKSKARRKKFILEIIVFIYSILLIIFKIVALTLINGGNEFFLDHKNIFIDFGVSYLISENEIIYLISTFIGESLVCFFSLMGIITNKVINITDDEVDRRYYKKLSYDQLFNIMRKYLYTCFFILSGVAVFSKSILSFIYIIPMFLLLFLYSIDLNRVIIYHLIRIFARVELFLLISEIILINLTNFYSIAHKFFSPENENKFLSIWHQLGFYYAYYRENELTEIFHDWIGYFFSCLSIVTFSLCLKAISQHELQIAEKEDESSDEQNEKKNFFQKVYDTLAEVLLNPYYILHICRIMAIFWIYIFRNFYSLGIFLWLFLSFIYLHISANKVLAKFVMIPSILISFFSIHISRIKGNFEDFDEISKIKYYHFALGKFNYDYLRYSFGIFFYFFTTYFLFVLNEYEKERIKNPRRSSYRPTVDNIQNKDIINDEISGSPQDINNININEYENIDNSLFEGGMNLDVAAGLENKLIFNKGVINNEDINFDDEEEIDEKDMKKITLYNIILKNFFKNIYKITLFTMYEATFRTVNILHLIFFIVFILQLFIPEFINSICLLIIIVFQLLYLVEYIMDLSKVYNYETFNSKDNIQKLKFYLPYDNELSETSINIFIFLVVYCFYVQYQLKNYKEYQRLIENKNINITNYLNNKLANYPLLKQILLLTGIIIINTFVWFIIIFFIFSSSYYEVNLLFCIKLGLFLISTYFLLLFIQDPQNKKLTLKSCKTIIFYSGINTSIVYLYQLLCNSYTQFKENNIDKSDNFFIKNLPNIGLTKYDEEDNLHLKLFPHFCSNVLSIFFLDEVERVIKSNKKIIMQKYSEKIKNMRSKKLEMEEKKMEKNENKGNVKKESAAEKYNNNKDKMTMLEIKNLFFNIILIITKFYWLFLFMTVCILFTSKYLTYGMIIYIIIFGLTFIIMFHSIIKNLCNFMKKDSYFISKVIRYSLVEVKSHIRRNSYSRKIAFQFLFGTNCIFLFILYFSGVLYLFENGCNPDYWEGCDDPSHSSFFNENDNNNAKRDLIMSLSYLFGFYVSLKENGVLSAAWAHLLLFGLIAFDVFIQKIENYFTDLSVQNRKEYKILANENIKLKPLSLLGETNIIANIESTIISKVLINKSKTLASSSSKDLIKKTDGQKESNNERENGSEIDIRNMSKKYFDYLEDKYKDLFDIIEILLKKNKRIYDEKDEYIGKRNIIQFLEIFQKASSSDVHLSQTNNRYKVINCVKQVFEEFISFLLICTAISKLNIWSFIYMIFALYLILTKKNVRKYYFLFCFIISSIILQDMIFVSNICLQTDPAPDKDILQKINEVLSLPWYKKYTDDRNAFFLGLGVNRKQINLMWMDYIEAIIIYIYLDFFSYSIYQAESNKGKVYKGADKINYYNLYLNPKVNKCIKFLREKEFKKYRKCMKDGFNIELGEFEDFKNKVLLKKPETELKKIKSKDKDIQKLYYTATIPKISTKIEIEPRETEPKKELPKDDFDKESPLLLALESSKKLASAKKNLFSKSMESSDDSSCLNSFKSAIYLSLHIIILIIIMIISMMVSGLLSIFYIFFSLIFLMKGNAIFLGDSYYYPKTIKSVLRVAILIDIAIQTLYQTPYINPSSKANTFYTILKIIGFNKIINFGEDKDSANNFQIYSEQMILVLAKAFTHFFISIQILIYSSQDFQEYYLSYLLTKNINLRRIALMNVFRFNNERIKVMGKSIKLRQEMENSMTILQNRLESWTKTLSSAGGKLYIGDNKSTKKKTIIKIVKKKDNKEEKQNDSIKKLSDPKAISNKNEENEDEEDEVKRDSKKFCDIFGIKLSDDNIKDKRNKYVPENIVKEQIKGWIFGSFLMKIQLWLHKNASSYTSIEANERDIYEKEIIQGRTSISSMLETLVEMQLNTLDLSKFTSDELKEVKKYFDGTREKELNEIKKEKEKKDKIIKATNQVIALSQLKKEIDKSIEEKKENQNDNNNEKIEEQQKETKEKDKDKKTSFYEDIKLKEKEKKQKMIDLTQPKFIELEKFTSNELFVKYLKTSYIIKCIITDIIAFCSNQFHWLCYIVMIIDHISSASLLTLFYPLSIFLYAIMEYPRPPKKYWNICLLYTVILIALKYIIQLELFVKIFDDENERDASGKLKNPYRDFIDNIQHYKVGLMFFETTFSYSFFNYIVCDALVIIFLLINNYLLLSKGLWIKREQEIETIYEAMERIASTKHLQLQTINETKSFNRKWLFRHAMHAMHAMPKVENLISKISYTKPGDHPKIKPKENKPSFYKRIREYSRNEKKNKNYMKPTYLANYNEKDRTYFERLFPKIRNEKPGNIYYASYTLTMLILIIYLLLFYTNMNQDKTFNSITVDTNQFSSSMIIFLLIHVIFVVYDRVVFISQNRNNLIYDYLIYDKKTCSPITESEFNHIKSEISLKYSDIKREKFFIPNEYIEEIQDKYNIIYIQTEEFNYPLFLKYILHIIITIFAHAFIFFYLPMKGNYNVSNTIYCLDEQDCNDFLYNPFLIIFYCIYVIYLIGSGLQVKYGFYDLKRKSLLKHGHSAINGGIYSAYKAIPFLYEIKLAIDWTFTSTCLDFFQWNKFEGVYDTIYTTYCSMTSKNGQLIGQKIKKLLKISIGGSLSFALVLSLVIPLLIFSSLNPTNQINNLTGATLKVDLSIFYENGANQNYTLYQNSKPVSIDDLFPDHEDDWYQYNYSESIETKNFPKKQIQKVEFFKESDRSWGLTKPHILKLIKTLEEVVKYKYTITDISKIYLVMEYQFERRLPVEARKASNRIDTLIYENNPLYNFNQVQKLKELETLFLACNSSTNVTFKNFYSVPIRLTANIRPNIIYDASLIFDFDVSLGFVGCEKEEDGKGINYLQSYFTLTKLAKNGISKEGLVFHVFSDKVSSSISGYSVITFYVSFILLLGNYIRNFFAGVPQKICLTELPNPESIINLCEGVLVSRYSFDYEQEEKLYYILMELMRSPDYLRLLTESSIQQFERRRELTISKSNITDLIIE